MAQPFNETPTYVAAVQRYEADVAKVVAELEEAKALAKSFPPKKRKQPANPDAIAARKRRDNLKAKLDTRKGKLKRLQDLKLSLWYLVEFLSAADGELWTTEQAESWSKELAAHEGRGEKALRIRYGITQVPHNEDCDIIRADGTKEEVKNLQGRTNKGLFNIQDIQTGHHGRKTYTRWMGVNAEAGLFKGLNDDLRDAIFSGEVPQSLLYRVLPENIRSALHEVLKPSNVLGYYDRMIGTTRFGSITIPKADFDAAWSLKTVTKSGPKYALRRQYVMDRLQRTLVSAVPAAA
jgi:hypothetical protein